MAIQGHVNRDLTPQVMDIMQRFQRTFPDFDIISGYRDPDYNRAKDGAKNSRHMHHDAFDFKAASGVSDERKQDAVRWLRNEGVKGLGTYTSGSFHADWAPGGNRAWGNNRSYTSLGSTPQWFQQEANAHRAGQQPAQSYNTIPSGMVSGTKVPAKMSDPQGYTAFGGQDSPRDRGNLSKAQPYSAYGGEDSPREMINGPRSTQEPQIGPQPTLNYDRVPAPGGPAGVPAGPLAQQFAPQQGAPQGLIGQMMGNPGARNFAFAGQPNPTQWGAPNYRGENPWGGGLIQKIAEAMGLKQPDGWGAQQAMAYGGPMTTGSLAPQYGAPPQAGAAQYVPAPQGYAGFGGEDSPRDHGNLSKALPQRAVGGMPSRPINGPALSGFDFKVSPQQFLGSDDVSRFPAGMRNNNPGNLKYSGSKWQQAHYPGMIGPSVNKDEGSPQIVFNSPQAGMQAMSNLIKTKTDQGMNTVYDLINNKNGWTPTAAGPGAAANIARTMGVDPNARLDFSDPKVFSSFQKALISQEHGSAGSKYHGLVDEAVGRALGKAPEAAPQAAAQPTQTPAPQAPAPAPAPQAQTATQTPAPPLRGTMDPTTTGSLPQRAEVGFGQRSIPQSPAAMFEQMKANGAGPQFASLTATPIQAQDRNGQPIRQIPIDGAPPFNPNPVTANPDVPAARGPAPTQTPAPALPENPLVVRGIRPHTEPSVPLPPQRPPEFAAMPVPLPPQRPPEFAAMPQPQPQIQPMPQRADLGMYPRTDAPDPHSWPGGMNPQQLAQLQQMQQQQPGFGGWFSGLLG